MKLNLKQTVKELTTNISGTFPAIITDVIMKDVPSQSGYIGITVKFELTLPTGGTKKYADTFLLDGPKEEFVFRNIRRFLAFLAAINHTIEEGEVDYEDSSQDWPGTELLVKLRPRFNDPLDSEVETYLKTEVGHSVVARPKVEAEIEEEIVIPVPHTKKKKATPKVVDAEEIAEMEDMDDLFK